MADASDVMNQLFPPPNPWDTITVYDGADPQRNGFAPWRAYDMRGWLRQLTWDLLRFRGIDEGRPGKDRTLKIGLYDLICRIAYQTDQNNELLRRITTKLDIDVLDLP